MLRRIALFDHVSPMSIEDTIARLPTLRQSSGHPTMTKPTWQHIDTASTMRSLASQGFNLHSVEVQNSRSADRAPYAKHMLRFRMPGLPDVAPGTVPEVLFCNGHDGTSSYKLFTGMFRFFCWNGMVSGAHWASFKVFHSGKGTGAKVLDASTRIVDSFGQLTDVVGTWRGIELDNLDRLEFASQALQLRYGVDAQDGTVQAPAAPARYLTARREVDESNDLWTVFNRVQENMLAGGVRGRAASGRRITTRRLSAIDESLRLNRRLFSLAEGFAANKAKPAVSTLAAFSREADEALVIA